jgi:Uma2 family endonuclease
MSPTNLTESESYSQEFFVEEDEIGYTRPQGLLIRYLAFVLEWLYRQEKWMIATNFHHYHPAVHNSKNLIIPDIAVFKDIPISSQEQAELKSWHISPPERPAPPVVFEISSSETWEWDISPESWRKPATYGRIGVQEYFAYDPNNPPLWRYQAGVRLLGWRYQNGQAVTLQPDTRGWLWSEVLESWLGPDGHYLRLYDRDGQQRLTDYEAEAITSQVEATARIAAEQRAAELETALQAEATARIAAEQHATELQRQLDEMRRQSGQSK